MYASHKSVKEFPHLHEGFFSEHFQGESIANLEGGGFNPEKNLLQVKLPSDFFLPNFWGQHTSGRCFNLPPIRKPIIKYPHSHHFDGIYQERWRLPRLCQFFFGGVFHFDRSVHPSFIFFLGANSISINPITFIAQRHVGPRQGKIFLERVRVAQVTNNIATHQIMGKTLNKKTSGSEKSLFRPCLCQFLCKNSEKFVYQRWAS